jgi:hypothetical protein
MGPWPEQADVRTDEGGWLSGPSVTVVDPKKIARVLGLYGRVLTGERDTRNRHDRDRVR